MAETKRMASLSEDGERAPMDLDARFGSEGPFSYENVKPRRDGVVFTVSEFIESGLIRDSALVAGAQGLDGAVNRINAIELLEDINWVRPGELVMTTGRLLRDHPERYVETVEALAERGASALGIRLSAEKDPLPQEAIELAERFRLPLIVLPKEAEFTSIKRELLGSVIEQESAQLAAIEERVQSVSRMLSGGSGIISFMDHLESLFGNPLAIVRKGKEPIYSRRLREAPETSETVVAGDWLFEEAALTSKGRGYRYPEEWLMHDESVMGDEPAGQLYVSDISPAMPASAYLILIGSARTVTSVDALTMDRLHALAGLELSNSEALREAKNKYTENFLIDWLSGRLASRTDIRLRAEAVGSSISIDRPFTAALVGLEEAGEQTLKAAADRISSSVFPEYGPIFAGVYERELVLVMPGERKADAKLMAELQTICGDREFYMYVGKQGSAEKLYASLTAAKRAKQVAAICRLNSKLVRYEDLGIYSLLYLVPRGEEWDAVLERYIEPILLADRKGGSLMETLEAFFRSNGNVRLTSEMLETHYNTVVYRLEKARQLLGADLDNAEVRLQLQLAIKMYRMGAQG
ncbi:PucR family transcriptional regulator [Paenibacillus methanolicus]|uniref:Purine catabolism regulator n=1 Tax=Paenibacillus methanolicus TaxID=582686 RepID=A0A5S5C290_9BACL|nr:PucR family transcriptional regulator [Paenibacillus methanolicus]TYP72718.1 purine catabolism regulator [Paenibacillus methanolicus]